MRKHVTVKADCRHCGRHAIIRGRGLCRPCYKKTALKYPKSYRAAKPEPTQEEVDRIVAEGYRNLPSWWESQQGVKCDD